MRSQDLKASMQQVFDEALTPELSGVYTLNNGKERTLYFDVLNTQSSMLLDDPFKLHLSYTQAMMGFKLFQQDPQTIVVVGLGGGSLSKYCFQRFPQARIRTLEISEKVIALREKFHVPADNEHFEIIHTDAATYMADAAVQSDVILLDGFDINGLPEALCSLSFYSDCHAALNDEGLLVANLLQTDSRVHRHIDRLTQVFDGNCLIARAVKSSNYILMAGKGERKLREDLQTVAQRRRIRQFSGMYIPHFKTLEEFYETESVGALS